MEEQIQIAKLQNKRGDTITVSIKNKRIINKYNKYHYALKFDNIEKMDQFLERHNPTKVTQEIANLSSSISVKVIQLIINNFSKQKAPALKEFTGEVYLIFKE